MDLRRMLNENQMVVGIIAVLVIVVALWAAFHFSGSSGGGIAGTYFTTDNGATWFRKNTDELAPIDSRGQQALRAYVFHCSDGKEFVGYLEKYTDEAKATLAELIAAKKGGPMPEASKIQAAASRGRLIKKPEDKEWVSASDAGKAMKVMKVTCPDGKPPMPAE